MPWTGARGSQAARHSHTFGQSPKAPWLTSLTSASEEPPQLSPASPVWGTVPSFIEAAEIRVWIQGTFYQGLIEGVPEELWMEVHDIVQKAVIKIIPKKKKRKKAKWLPEAGS